MTVFLRASFKNLTSAGSISGSISRRDPLTRISRSTGLGSPGGKRVLFRRGQFRVDERGCRSVPVGSGRRQRRGLDGIRRALPWR